MDFAYNFFVRISKYLVKLYIKSNLGILKFVNIVINVNTCM